MLCIIACELERNQMFFGFKKYWQIHVDLSDPFMGTRWDEVLCSFFQVLIVISFLRASREEVFQACALTEGFKLACFVPSRQEPFTLFCWVSVISLTFSSVINASVAEGWMFCSSFSLLLCRLLLRSSKRQCYKKLLKCTKDKWIYFLLKNPSKQKKPNQQQNIQLWTLRNVASAVRDRISKQLLYRQTDYIPPL